MQYAVLQNKMLVINMQLFQTQSKYNIIPFIFFLPCFIYHDSLTFSPQSLYYSETLTSIWFIIRACFFSRILQISNVEAERKRRKQES